MVVSVYSWKWETIPGSLWAPWGAWTTWTAWTKTFGTSDLRMNLLVGDEVTHNTNVPGVVEEGSVEHFPLVFYHP